jgi:hypothetical protein
MLQAVRDARRLLSSARTLWSFAELGERWGVSVFTIRRLADQNLIATINIGARRLVKISEIERCEAQGVGKARPRKTKAAV